MNISADDKLKALVVHGMILSTETFDNFCKLINGFPEEEVARTFDSLTAEELDIVSCNVDKVAAELAALVLVLQERHYELKETPEGNNTGEQGEENCIS